jgi:acyl homoserine lactone synthase
MLRYLYSHELMNYPKLRTSMFRDRAVQFKDRLKWAVDVDENGFEQDEYDDLNPLYAIWIRPNGSHGGSMRVLPTTGRVMVNDHFGDVIGHEIQSEHIWETTRFCLSPDQREGSVQVSAALMLAGCQIGLRQNLESMIAIFDPRMVRVYRRLGWPPKILGTIGVGRDRICAGTWTFDRDTHARMAQQAGIPVALSELWYTRSMGAQNSIAA